MDMAHFYLRAINTPHNSYFYSHTHHTLVSSHSLALIPHFSFHTSHPMEHPPPHPHPYGGSIPVPEPERQRRISPVWTEGHFEYRLVTLEDGTVRHQALCKWPECNMILGAAPRNGTGHLERHLNRHRLAAARRVP